LVAIADKEKKQANRHTIAYWVALFLREKKRGLVIAFILCKILKRKIIVLKD
jgi:hypothetical protein